MNKHLNNTKEMNRQGCDETESKKVISIDFDGTICKKQKYGDGLIYQKPNKGAKEFIDKLKNNGYTIIILTVRMNPDCGGNLLWKKYQIESWLERFEIPYDKITNNKPDADLYIDDKALRFTSWKDVDDTFDSLNINKHSLLT